MKKPTLKELRDYANSIGFTEFDPEEFLLHYGSVGWYIGKAKMKNWKLTVQTWKKHASQRRKPTARLPYKTREQRINNLNERIAQLRRMPETKEQQRELAAAMAERYKL